VTTTTVEARQLRKAFGPIQAVDGVDLALEPGRTYGLLGPNGSGKTTLIRLLTGLARPSGGGATVLGTPLPDRAVLARVGYMTQADGVYGELSVLENIRFYAAMYGVRDAASTRHALEVVELADRQSTPAEQLSGGLRRRLSLACALVHTPAVLFLDEPTVGVDPVLRVQFWEHFRSLSAAGATLVVSSHVMDEADRCDELILMRAGRILAQGSPAELRAAAGTQDLEAIFLKANGLTSGDAA
jgi:ABC-2 type transport system ATP-binding protein